MEQLDILRSGDAPPPSSRTVADPEDAIGPDKITLGGLAWSLHQGVRAPYVILITIYIFSPFFANELFGDAVRGQELIATITMGYGLVTAATSVVLILLGIIFNWGDVLHNSLLPYAAGPGCTTLLSGWGFASASMISVILLVFMLWALVLSGTVS